MEVIKYLAVSALRPGELSLVTPPVSQLLAATSQKAKCGIIVKSTSDSFSQQFLDNNIIAAKKRYRSNIGQMLTQRRRRWEPDIGSKSRVRRDIKYSIPPRSNKTTSLMTCDLVVSADTRLGEGEYSHGCDWRGRNDITFIPRLISYTEVSLMTA